MWSALNRVVVLKIIQNLICLTCGVSESLQGFWNCAVYDLDDSAAHEPLVLDQGNVWLNARRVAVHHEGDRPRRRDHGYLGVLEAEPLPKRQGLVPGPYCCINQILRNILARNLASVGSMHPDNVEEWFLVARVASEGSQPLGDD